MPSTSGTFWPVEDAKVIWVDAKDPAKTVQVGASLSLNEEGELVEFLWRNKDVFVWRPADMSGIFWEVTEHTLNIKPGSKSVKQGLRRLNKEKRKTIGKELAKLLTAGFIKEV
jgi:hypothetical protein